MANPLLKGRRAWVEEIECSRWHAICCAEALLEGWLPVETFVDVMTSPCPPSPNAGPRMFTLPSRSLFSLTCGNFR